MQTSRMQCRFSAGKIRQNPAVRSEKMTALPSSGGGLKACCCRGSRSGWRSPVLWLIARASHLQSRGILWHLVASAPGWLPVLLLLVCCGARTINGLSKVAMQGAARLSESARTQSSQAPSCKTSPPPMRPGDVRGFSSSSGLTAQHRLSSASNSSFSPDQTPLSCLATTPVENMSLLCFLKGGQQHLASRSAFSSAHNQHQ